MALTQTQAYEEIRTSYGGSDPTLPSFLRPQYIQYNSITKSRDLGPLESIVVDVSGAVGSQAGSNTLYFKVELLDAADIQILKRSTGNFTDRFISVGLLNGERKPVALDSAGFGSLNDIHNTTEDESLRKLDPGTYYITISSREWQAVPFAATILVIKYTLLSGAAVGRSTSVARLPLLKISGFAPGQAPAAGTIKPPGAIKKTAGAASGSALPSLALVIMRGIAGGTMSPYGRLQGNWKISGAAGGSAPCSGTLTSEAPYGYGY